MSACGFRDKWRLLRAIRAGSSIDALAGELGDVLAGRVPGRTPPQDITIANNPTLRLHDLQAAARVCRARGIVTVADNTPGTPFLPRPIEYGIDRFVHSMTKYLGGHADCTCENS